MHRTAPALAALLLALTACGGGADPDEASTTTDEPSRTDSPSPDPTSTPSPSPTDDPSPTSSPSPDPTSTATDGDVEAMPFETCTAERYEIGHPASWETNDPAGIADACRVFHPDPIDLPDRPQDLDLHWAVVVYVDAVPFDDAAGSTTNEVLSERSATVDGRDALVTEVRGTGEALLPEGVRQYGWAVDLDGATLFASTTTVGETDYDRDRAVLDRMMSELRISDVEPLAGPASTDRSTGEHTGAPIVLTDVDVAGYAGFDRITLAVGGDGQAGWDVAWEPSPRSQGSGRPVEVEGGATLRVTLTGAALPPDAPVEPYDGPERIEPTSTEVVLELLDDTVFEGRHDLFVGVDRERPFRVGRRDGAVVIDVLLE